MCNTQSFKVHPGYDPSLRNTINNSKGKIRMQRTEVLLYLFAADKTPLFSPLVDKTTLLRFSLVDNNNPPAILSLPRQCQR